MTRQQIMREIEIARQKGDMVRVGFLQAQLKAEHCGEDALDFLKNMLGINDNHMPRNDIMKQKD